jgi:hypothetical protein
MPHWISREIDNWRYGRDTSCQLRSSNAYILFPEVARALLAVKTMGKIPAGSRLISSPTNLLALLTFSKHFKDDPAASNEALKCVANALLLIEHARITWLQDVVDGGRACIEMLEVSDPHAIQCILQGLEYCAEQHITRHDLRPVSDIISLYSITSCHGFVHRGRSRG